MELTLFTLPRSFEPPFDTLQHNALESWTTLNPRPSLLFFGSEKGTSDAARRYGAEHIPIVATNSLGTPLVDDLFRTATQHTQTRYQGFVNSDIILDPRLTEVLERVFAWRTNALIVSRRWDLPIDQPIDFSPANWFSPLQKRARMRNELYSHHGADVFVFPTGTFDDMPPFTIGWPGGKYDNWLIYSARRRGLPVVEITEALTNIHQTHPTGDPNPAKLQEHWTSLDLLGGHGCCFDLLDATHSVGADGVLRWNRPTWQDMRRRAVRLAQRCRYQFRRKLYNFSYAAAHRGANA